MRNKTSPGSRALFQRCESLNKFPSNDFRFPVLSAVFDVKLQNQNLQPVSGVHKGVINFWSFPRMITSWHDFQWCNTRFWFQLGLVGEVAPLQKKKNPADVVVGIIIVGGVSDQRLPVLDSYLTPQRLYRKIGKSKKWKFIFSIKDMHCPWVLIYLWSPIEWLTFLLKLVNMLLFSTKKTEFPFLVFPYFGVIYALLNKQHVRHNMTSAWRSATNGNNCCWGSS